MTASTSNPSKTRSWNYVFAGIRLVLGVVLLWAFFDKLLDWSYATKPANAWINGGSPTNGFLAHTTGTSSGFFHTIAGNS